MVRWLSLVILILTLLAGISVGVLAQAEDARVVSGRVLENLYLISEQSKPAWGDGWSAPIQAATILGWYQMRGYTPLLSDWTEDGEIDVLDAIELADYFGRNPMQSDSVAETSDARLMDTLARYVAARAPDEFEILIYDAGFAAEYQDEYAQAFTSNMIPGIRLSVETEPSFDAYSRAILSGLGVIVGIASDMSVNDYLTGRSFVFQPIEEGTHAVDFAWAAEDVWTPETQGRVLQTITMAAPDMQIEFEGSWRDVEFMAVLAPIDRPTSHAAALRTGSTGAECGGPDLAVSVADAYCVPLMNEEGIVLPYTEVVYLVSNVGDEESPACEATNYASGSSISFAFPPLAPGESTAVFGMGVEAGRSAPCGTHALVIDSGEEIDECHEEDNTIAWEECCEFSSCVAGPDLAISVDRSWCVCPSETSDTDCPDAGVGCTISFDATITNIGDQTSTRFFVWGTEYRGLAPRESVAHHDSLSTWWCITEPEETLPFVRVVTGSEIFDATGEDIDDCDPTNNSAEFPVFCVPPPCVDLALSIDNVECISEWVESGDCPDGRELIYAPVMTVTVTNIGELDAEASTLHYGDSLGLLFGDLSHPVPALAIGEAVTLELGVAEESVSYGAVCGDAPHSISLYVSVGSRETDCNYADNAIESIEVLCEPATCPDLEVLAEVIECECGESPDPAFDWECVVPVRVTVTNIGSAEAADFMVGATSFTGTGAWVEERLAPGEAVVCDVMAYDYGSEGAPEEVTVVVQADTVEGECNEENNTVDILALCGCSGPDLAVYVSGTECVSEWIEDPEGVCSDGSLHNCIPVAIVGVSNLGDADASAFTVRASHAGETISQGSLGLAAGGTEYFRFEFPAVLSCSTDAEWLPVSASVELAGECDSGNNDVSFAISCEPPPLCPDLVIENARANCRCGWTPQQTYECMLEVTLTVRNVGVAPVDEAFEVTVETSESALDLTLGELEAGGSRRLTFEIAHGDATRIEYTATVDSTGAIEECDEDNNTFESSRFCR